MILRIKHLQGGESNQWNHVNLHLSKECRNSCRFMCKIKFNGQSVHRSLDVHIWPIQAKKSVAVYKPGGLKHTPFNKHTPFKWWFRSPHPQTVRHAGTKRSRSELEGERAACLEAWKAGLMAVTDSTFGRNHCWSWSRSVGVDKWSPGGFILTAYDRSMCIAVPVRSCSVCDKLWRPGCAETTLAVIPLQCCSSASSLHSRATTEYEYMPNVSYISNCVSTGKQLHGRNRAACKHNDF